MGEFLAQLKLLWPLVMEAPWAFASCAAIFLIAGWAAGRFMYGQRIDILKERIEAYREKLDGATSSEMKQQALKREANLVDLRSSDPVSIGRDQVENTPDKHSIPGNPVLDPKKVGLIDELYPLIHDFSEINVDRIGTIAGD